MSLSKKANKMGVYLKQGYGACSPSEVSFVDLKMTTQKLMCFSFLYQYTKPCIS